MWRSQQLKPIKDPSTYWDKVVISAGMIEVHIRMRDTRDVYLPIVMQPRIGLSGSVMPNWFGLFSIRASKCFMMPSQLGFRCIRCNKGFRSASAREQHIRDSANHYICQICPEPFDYETQNELNDHLETEHHICTYCDRPPFRTSKQLDQHDVDKHNMCIVCRKYYRTIQNLKMVGLSCSIISTRR